MFFQSDSSFDEFSWEIKTTGPRRRSGTKIILGEDGVLTVTKSGRGGRKQYYKPGPASIPEFLLDLAFSQMLESDHVKVIINTINADGEMVGAVVSRVRADSGPSQTEAEYKLKVDFLDDRRSSREVRLDSRGRILKVFLEPQGVYFERTSAGIISRLFPEWADYILKKREMLEQSQP